MSKREKPIFITKKIGWYRFELFITAAIWFCIGAVVMAILYWRMGY